MGCFRFSELWNILSTNKDNTALLEKSAYFLKAVILEVNSNNLSPINVGVGGIKAHPTKSLFFCQMMHKFNERHRPPQLFIDFKQAFIDHNINRHKVAEAQWRR